MNKEDHVKVCIVGAGKVGKSLAAQLSDSGYKVTVIDTSLEQVNNISNSYDVICYQGNGASTEVLEDAGVASAEIFIAVTGSVGSGKTDWIDEICNIPITTSNKWLQIML